MLHLTVTDGLCHRLMAIVCAMRYCRDIQHELTIHWRLPVARTGLRYNSAKIFLNENLNVFFQIPPNITLKHWEPTTMKVLTDDGKSIILLDEQMYRPEFMPRNLWGNPIYPENFDDMVHQPLILPSKQQEQFKQPDLEPFKNKDLVINFTTRPFGYGTDTVGLLRTFQENPQIVWKKTEFEQELHTFAHKLSPIKTIENIILYEKKQIFSGRSRVGFHFRRTDLRPHAKISNLEKILQSTYLPKFKNWDIFICSDDPKLQTYFQTRFPQMKAYSDATKYQNDVFGTQRAMVDLYLLADCNHIIGTRGSCFSYYAWLLSDNETTFEYHS